jgi:dihydroxyacetone kinase-like protein
MDINDIKKLFAAWAEAMLRNKDYLIDLDSVAGDGDLGLTMSDGFAAASSVAQADAGMDIGKLIYQAGKAFGSAAPSSMGTLFAAGFMSAGMALKGMSEVDATGAAKMIAAFADGIARLGKAKEGEKTVLDALYPAVRAFYSKATAGESIAEAAAAAAKAAEDGFNNTASMAAVHGRIATRGERSVGILDPGAAAAALLLKTFAAFVS